MFYLYKQIINSRKKYLWLLPSLILLLVFAIYPIFQVIITSFKKLNLSGLAVGWAGMENYIEVFTVGKGTEVFANTLVWTVSCLVITHILSMFIALALNISFPGRKIVRTIILIPWACAQVITALTWRWIFNYDYGFLNLLLRQMGLINENIYWLSGVTTSWISVIIVGVFVSIPFTTFVLLAGLQSIPLDIYEAARVDGAGGWYKFRKITLPLLKPVITISIVINAMYTFNNFHIIYAITKGGPAGATDIAVTYMHRLAFEMSDLGRAAAMTVIIFIILIIFSILYIKSMSSDEI